MATKKSSKKTARKRELIEPTQGDKRFVRRSATGQFRDVVDVGRSLAADRRSTSKTSVKSGQGDKGDVKRSPAKSTAKKASTKKASTKSASKSTKKAGASSKKASASKKSAKKK